MEDRKKPIGNILIMIAPVSLPALFFLLILGESFFLFAVPLAICLFMAFGLASRLSRQDAITYPFVQYPFLALLLCLFWMNPPGLGFIIILPLTFIINMSIGYVYFRFAKKKRWFTKVSVLLLTLVITLAIYPPVI